MDPKRELLRHTVATLAYRGAKAVASAPEGFATTRVCPTSRSAIEVLAHIGDLLQWDAWDRTNRRSASSLIERRLGVSLGRVQRG